MPFSFFSIVLSQNHSNHNPIAFFVRALLIHIGRSLGGKQYPQQNNSFPLRRQWIGVEGQN